MTSITIFTKDQFPIRAHLFEPQNPNGKLLLINSATGVQQHMYFSFARFFSENGFVVITYDYRGIGDSKPKKLKGFKANMRIWGSLDYEAITQFIQEKYPEKQKFCMGHSVGALILGMNGDSQIFQKFVFVNTQKAYIGNLNVKTKIEAFLGFGFALPVLTTLLGYFPANWFGLGKPLPYGVAFDWRILILNKKSTNQLLEKTRNIAHELRQKTVVISAEDDNWITEKGLETLMKETYPNLDAECRRIKTSESEKEEIGHINFFRSYNKKLWEIPLKWLD